MGRASCDRASEKRNCRRGPVDHMKAGTGMGRDPGKWKIAIRPPGDACSILGQPDRAGTARFDVIAAAAAAAATTVGRHSLLCSLQQMAADRAAAASTRASIGVKGKKRGGPHAAQAQRSAEVEQGRGAPCRPAAPRARQQNRRGSAAPRGALRRAAGRIRGAASLGDAGGVAPWGGARVHDGRGAPPGHPLRKGVEDGDPADALREGAQQGVWGDLPERRLEWKLGRVFGGKLVGSGHARSRLRRRLD
eukprot:gene7367-biopygen2016